MPACVGGTSTRMTCRSIAFNSVPAVSSCSSFIDFENDRICGWFPTFPNLNDHRVVMNRDAQPDSRKEALDRAERHSPFLRDAMRACPEIAQAFLAEGAGAAAELALSSIDEDVDSGLRRQKRGLALAVALGDLAGELSLEETTRLLSDFADSAIDVALK